MRTVSTAPSPANSAALILAAGFSRRLGRPKQALTLGGASLLERTIRTAQAAGLDPILAVVNDPSWTIVLAPLGVVVLQNPDAHEGMSASVRVGVRWLEHNPVAGAVLLACDQPALQPDHLRVLCADPTRVSGSRYANRNGVPAYFPAQAFPSLLQLSGDTGARSMLQNAAFILNEALALDIDTEEDLRRAEQQIASGLL